MQPGPSVRIRRFRNMEPGSISAQRGTLEDPEVLHNVPGHVIPILEQEFDDFKTEAGKFLEGETP